MNTNKTESLTELQGNCLARRDGFMCRSVQFTDATSYSRDNKIRIPTAFSAKLGNIQVYISCGHIAYRPTWIVTCHALSIDAYAIGNYDEPYDAAEAAFSHCHTKLSKLNAAFNPTR